MLKPSLLLALLCLAAPAARADDFGAFLGAQFAARQGDVDRAASEMLAALDADPASPQLRANAFALATLAGRPEARSLAASLPDNPAAQMLLANDHAADGEWVAAELGYAELAHQPLGDALRPVLMAWAQAAQGLTDKALATLQPAVDSGKLSGLYLLHAALIADYGHRDGQAQRFYSQLQTATTEPNLRTTQILASWQARSGDATQARATLESLRQGGDVAIALPGLLAAMAEPVVADPKAGIAEAFTAMGASLRQQNSPDVAQLMTRLALALQPNSIEARLIMADIDSGRHLLPEAAAELERVSATDPLRPFVQLRLAGLYGRIDRKDEAEALLERLAAEHPESPAPFTQLGDLEADEQDFPDAVAAYDRAVARVPAPSRQDWSLFYSRGIALQRAHDWPRAETDMKHALALSPDQPFVLNFLGFSWTEQNRNLEEARQMIQRALDQRPDDGAIVDSLGWVQLRLGNTPDAVRLLQKAAQLQPEDATITGHLGDAYWAAGRHDEAEDQWRRALVLKPEPEDRARIETRLKSATVAN